MGKLASFALFLAAISAAPAFAVKEYYALSRSIRALGMGGTFYGLSDDEAALFYNPAGLSLYPGSAQFMLSFGGQVANSALSSVNTISDAANSSGDIDVLTTKLETLQGKPVFASAGIMPYFIARGFAVGLLVAEPKADFALLGRNVDSSVDVTAISDSGLFVGFAGSLFHPNLHFGMTLKALARAGGQKEFQVVDLLTNDSLKLEDLGGAGGGIDSDVGMTYVFGGNKGRGNSTGGVSLALSNLLATKFTIARREGAPPGLVRTASLGGYYQFTFAKRVDYLRFMADFAEIGLGGESDADRGARGGSLWKHVNLGVEMPIGGFLFLRTGIHQGNLTGGLGVHAYAVKLDFATYAEELASGPGRLTSRRWALRLALGFGAPRALPGSRRRK